MVSMNHRLIRFATGVAVKLLERRNEKREHGLAKLSCAQAARMSGERLLFALHARSLTRIEEDIRELVWI